MTESILGNDRLVLRHRVIDSLEAQGFSVSAGLLVPPDQNDKENLRRLHKQAIAHKIEQARPYLRRHENRLLRFIAAGTEVDPLRVQPRLVEVLANSEEELLFRYARLHWSIPVSAGYGRRLRFVVLDEANGKLIGLFGLGDPVIGLFGRDEWIGWSVEQKREHLRAVMDLFVLGAVPPYSQLLCSKLIALLATSQEVQEAFRRKYEGQSATISGRKSDGRLALLTTTSALGRSSVYNRLHYRGQVAFIRAGFTRGSGEFQFGNGIYSDLRQLALECCAPTSKHRSWGEGFRNRRELLRKALPLLDLSPDLLYHGIRREIFVAPLGENAAAFLRGDDEQLRLYQRSTHDLFNWFRERWLLPRSRRHMTYRGFSPASYRLWKE